MQSRTFSLMAIATLTAACVPANGDTSATSGSGTSASAGAGASQETSTTISSTSGNGGGAGGASTTGGAGGGGGAGGSGGAAIAPTVTSTTPLDGASNVPINASASVLFDEAMDCASLTATTFTLTYEAAAVPGTVICAGAMATFWPAAHLAAGGAYTATITTAAKGLGGANLAARHAWSFTTGALVAPGVPVDLGTAGAYVILAKAAISTVPTSAITGDLGCSPAAASFITGFSPLAKVASGVYATSSQVTGKVYAADYAVPTPLNLTTAIGDMQLAFTDAAGRAPDTTELGAGNIGGLTLDAGVYRWGTALQIPTDVTLTGSATDVWIFQIAQDLVVSDAAQVDLTGGAVAKNVFWQVAGLVSVGTTAHLEGVVLTQTAVTLGTGASVTGRLLAQTAVSLESNLIVQPAP
jgi:hypothetical protein